MRLPTRFRNGKETITDIDFLFFFYFYHCYYKNIKSIYSHFFRDLQIGNYYYCFFKFKRFFTISHQQKDFLFYPKSHLNLCFEDFNNLLFFQNFLIGTRLMKAYCRIIYGGYHLWLIINVLFGFDSLDMDIWLKLAPQKNF